MCNISATSTEKNQINFAYVTQICYYIFEKNSKRKEASLYQTTSIIRNRNIRGRTFDIIDGDTSGMVNSNVEWLQDNYNLITEIKEIKEGKKNRRERSRKI